MTSSATLSDCGTYRYRLTRSWGLLAPERIVFVMLNPSTADAQQDDPTIRRCKGFAIREGMGTLEVVNLFGLRATNPVALRHHPDPVGPENNWHIRQALEGAAQVVVAWGTHAPPWRVGELEPVIRDAFPKVVCFGLTAGGMPRHPLYVPAAAPFIPWEP